MFVKRRENGVKMQYTSHVIPERRENELFLTKKHAPAGISFKELSVHVYTLILGKRLKVVYKVKSVANKQRKLQHQLAF